MRAAFPDATIIRPSVVFGAEDDFTNRFASMARLPDAAGDRAAARASSRCSSRDLGQAIAMAALDPQRFGGHSYDIAGPEVLTMRELNARIAALAGHSPELRRRPRLRRRRAWPSSASCPARRCRSDQWLMLQRDNVAADDASGLEAFGIVPTPLDAVAPEWLGRFVKGGRFAQRATG